MGNSTPYAPLLTRTRPLPLDAPEAIDCLELHGYEGAPHLLASTPGERGGSLLRLYTLGAAEAPRTVATCTLPPQMSRPEWSAALEPGGSFSVALTEPGSAKCPLLHFRGGASATSPLSPAAGLRVFMQPRFVRRSAGPAPVVAIESRAQRDVIVLFSPAADGRWSERLLHEPPGRFVHDSVVVRSGEGYLLFYKTPVAPGTTDAPRSRPRPPAPPVAEVDLGAVHALRLDADFGVVGSAFPIPGGEALFELDVDVDGDRVVLLGVTPTGFVLIEGRMAEDAFVPVARLYQDLPAVLTAPAVLIAEGIAHFALVQGAGAPGATVLHGGP